MSFEESSPRHVKDHQKSRIFDQPDNNNANVKLTPQRCVNTQNRLFGPEEVQRSPRKLNPTYDSKLFTADGSQPQSSPAKKTPVRNPVTGEQYVPGSAPPAVNGHSNGHYVNGDIVATTPKHSVVRQPPGGTAHEIF